MIMQLFSDSSQQEVFIHANNQTSRSVRYLSDSPALLKSERLALSPNAAGPTFAGEAELGFKPPERSKKGHGDFQSAFLIDLCRVAHAFLPFW
jgi:hypothetical protein